MFTIIGSILLVVIVLFLIFIASINNKDTKSTINDDFLKDCVYIDTETTGLSDRDRIVEISAIRVRNNEIVDSFSELVNPHMHIKKGASSVNRITDDMVVGCPEFSSIEKTFMEFIGDDVLVGHNINFDLDFIGREIGESLKNPTFDSIRLAKLVMENIENYKLETLCRKFGFPSQNHRGLTDVALTYRVVQAMKAVAAKKKIRLSEQMNFTHIDRTYQLDVANIVPDGNAVSGFFAGKRVVFSGVLPIRRRDAMQAVVNQGGKIGTNITKTTDYLVVGDGDAEQAVRLQAVKAIGEGQDLKILSPATFMEKIKPDTPTIRVKDPDCLQTHMQTSTSPSTPIH